MGFSNFFFIFYQDFIKIYLKLHENEVFLLRLCSRIFRKLFDSLNVCDMSEYLPMQRGEVVWRGLIK